MLPGYVQFWTAIAVAVILAWILALVPVYVLLYVIWRRLQCHSRGVEGEQEQG